jgi:hypothetical protein
LSRSFRSRAAAVVLGVVVVAALGILLVRGAMGRTGELQAREGEIADFGDLPQAAANRFLMCPKTGCNIRADAESPAFDLPWEELRDAWSDLVAHQRRVKLVAGDGDLGKITYIQRSPLLHLPEVITIQFIPLGERRSTFAVVSQSRYFWPDLGSNKIRVETWVRQLQAMTRGTR